MSRLLIGLGLALFLLLQDGANAVAQEQMILGTTEVLDELEANEDQRDKLLEIHGRFKRIQGMTALHLSNGIPYRSLSTRQQQELRPKIIEAMIDVDARARTEIAAILTPTQLTRLQQLRVQALGPAGLLGGKFNDDLGISDEQMEQLQTQTAEFRAEFSESRMPEMTDLKAAEINDIYKSELAEMLLQALTEEQQAAYRKMFGEPVELPQIAEIR